MRAMLIVLMLWALVGCHSGKALVPAGWEARAPGQLPATRAEVGRLQVIICYGAGLSNHAAVRIESPGQLPLFWDPGGRYGTGKPFHEKSRGVVLSEPPTMAEYFTFRTDYCGEKWMEVFEWDLAPEVSARLRAVLWDGRKGERGTFDTFYPGLYCAVGVSEYLQKYGKPLVDVKESYFLPHSLAAHLWTQRPTRVWEYRYPQGITVYFPPAGPATPLVEAGTKAN